MYVASSMTPTVVTSPVGCPRFFVSQAVSSGLCLGTCVVPSRSVSSDLDTLTPVRARRTFHDRHPVETRAVAVQEITEMADRRDWGGGGDDPEESTQLMIERIWESLTDIQARMDQQASVPPVVVPPGDGEVVHVAPVPPRVEVPFAAPLPPPPPVLIAEEPVMQVEKFLRLQPPTYSGGPNPDTAEHWVHEIERVFATMRCPAVYRVVLAAYQLRGFALEWWRLKMQTTFAGRAEEAITWSEFLDVFNDTFFPIQVQQVKREQFRTLQQASSTTPTVVTSPVGCPRFFVSQAVSSGLCLSTCVVLSRSVSSDLDTLTPVFELYVRLRERRQWDSDTCEWSLSTTVLKPEGKSSEQMSLSTAPQMPSRTGRGSQNHGIFCLPMPVDSIQSPVDITCLPETLRLLLACACRQEHPVLSTDRESPQIRKVFELP
ncbi:hypothetical protein Taro_051664 [Colocasia esculenta]|uniref:Retrotransposon gag domain-containing protein n=1 Tax=Colocasia esculenta TaxID=4460 RepID=A0A843XGI3_COLES|nr:hypothetical protein [Colocasia esculenta]